MVNLRAIANKYTSGINPNLAVVLYAYAGYGVSASGKALPAYAAPVDVIAQVQALSIKEIQHLDALNVTGCTRSAYVNRQLFAIDRITQNGADVLTFEGTPWQVTAILENWTSSGPWCKAALTQQQVVTGEFGF